MTRVKAEGQAGSSRQTGRKKKSILSRYIDRGPCDYSFLFIVVFLVLFGLVMMYSASLYTDTYFGRQRMFAVVGIIAMLVVSHFNYRTFRKWSPYLIAFSFILILMLFTPLGVSRNGATRWLAFGPLTFQPAEIFKIAVILFNARVLTSVGANIRKTSNTIRYIGLALVEALVVYGMTANLSSGIIVGAIAIAMLFVAGPDWKVILICVGVVVLFVTVIVLYARMIVENGADSGVRMGRILRWLYPEKYSHEDEIFQTMQSLYAVGSGGMWGKGLGNSTQKMVLPEAMNDTVFAIICEELGFVGASFVIVIYVILLHRLYYIIRNAKEQYGSFLVAGIFSHIAIQVILNIAVVTNSMPNTGITLPFISYGGTALCILLVEMGIALNVSRHLTYK